jgi:hypothetical protein
MRFVGLPENVVDIEFLAEPGIQFVDADFDFAAQLLERLDALQKLPADCACAASGRAATLLIAIYSVLTMPAVYHIAVSPSPFRTSWPTITCAGFSRHRCWGA